MTNAGGSDKAKFPGHSNATLKDALEDAAKNAVDGGKQDTWFKVDEIHVLPKNPRVGEYRVTIVEL